MYRRVVAAGEGSAFTLLFEQAALALVREMPVLAAGRLMDITDTRRWRIERYYMDHAIARFELSAGRAIGLHEATCKRGYQYVIVFIDMARRQEPVLFVTPGRGKGTLRQFAAFLLEHRMSLGRLLRWSVACRGPSCAASSSTCRASITVSWFRIVQFFTHSVDAVRKLEGKEKSLPNHMRWAVLKRGYVGHLIANQLVAIAEMTKQGLDTYRLDLPDRELRGRHPQIHMKCRRTIFWKLGIKLFQECC